MELARCTYTGDKRTDTFIAIILGSHEGHVHCLKSQFLTNEDISKVLLNKESLAKMSILAIAAWCKKNLVGYKTAYRTLSKGRLTIEDKYG